MTTIELDGRWAVTINDEFWGMFNFLCDHKVIRGGYGYNIIHGYKFGYFTIETTPEGLVLNYDDPRNPIGLRGVRDTLVKTEKGYDGKLYRNGNFGFDFTLTQV